MTGIREATVGITLGFVLFGPLAKAAPSTCPDGAPVGDEGHRRLALIVGVGRYADPTLQPLEGAPQDARRIYELLTGENGYDFPKQNTCLLLDEQATYDRLHTAFHTLSKRASEGDVAVFYYAGHGSQVEDVNGDEADRWDETLLLYDSRTEGLGDLVDDEIHQMLAAVQRKTRYVTAIFDSCHSGSVLRGATARYVPPAVGPPSPSAPRYAGPNSDGSSEGLVSELPGLVVLSAAGDGTWALEANGSGIFTDALVSVLSSVDRQPLTYAQVARQVPPLVAAKSYQVPSFHGDLDRVVFGAIERTRPVALEVRSLSPDIELAGPPIPGVGPGAELRVYDGAATGGETRDPGKAKATLVVHETHGLNATARVVQSRPGAPAIREGDLAVLVRPADKHLRMRVRLRPADEPGGLSESLARAVREAVEADEESRLAVDLVTQAGDLELSAGDPDRLELRDPEGTARDTFSGPRQATRVADSLWRFARQRALLLLRGEGGADFTDGETLQVQIVPAISQSICASEAWLQSEANREQIVPLCHRWEIRVSLAPSSPIPLLIGGVVLASDGSMFGFPDDGVQQKLRPGDSFTLPHLQFEASLPLELAEHLLVFGTQETNPVPWHLLTATASQRRSSAESGGPLYRALHRYLQPGTRASTSVLDGEVEDTTWTMSAVRYRVRWPDAFGSRSLEGACSPSISCGRPATSYLDPGPERKSFGQALATDGETAFVGIPAYSERGERAGAVDLFRREESGWAKAGTLLSGETSGGDSFGLVLAAADGTLVVGAPFADLPGADDSETVQVIERGAADWSRRLTVAQAGAAYVFQRHADTWVEQTRLTADRPVRWERFGDAVAVHGDTIVVGASAYQRAPAAPGSVRVFRHAAAGWQLQARLQSSRSSARDAFGRAVALRGDIVVVGAPEERDGLGAIYVFQRLDGVWVEEARLIDPDSRSGTGFGSSLALLDGLLVAGVPSADELPAVPGRVHVFQPADGAWQRTATLQVSDVQDGFGLPLAATDSLLAVGARSRVHVFDRRGGIWTRSAELAGDEDERFWAVGALAFAKPADSDPELLVGSAEYGEPRQVYVFAMGRPR